MTTHYKYRARNWSGDKIRGQVRALSREDALQTLEAQQMVVIELKQEQKFTLFLLDKAALLLNRLGYRTYNSRTLMIFCRQFSTMLEAGIPILQSLKILSEQAELGTMREEFSQLSLNIEEGSTLAAAMKSRNNIFPPMMVNMVAAGEAGGVLDLIMSKMADHFEAQHDFSEKMRSATLYPIFIVFVALAVMAVMILFVLPQFAQIFDSVGMEMPFYTRILLSLGSFGSRSWILLVAASFLFIAAILAAVNTTRGRHFLDLLRLRLPLFGRVYGQALAARFARTLSTLLNSGVPLHEALSLVDRVVDNSIFSGSIKRVNAALGRGESISVALRREKYFPSLLVEMIRIGEETGALDQTLDKTAVFYEREVTYVVDRLSSILEPLLLLVVGLFIGLLVFSIISPMYSVFQMI